MRYWMFIPISEAEGDWNEFGPSEREVVTDYNSMSAFLVVHPPGSWPTLRVFLRDLLLEYGGWVGSASDNWQPIFTTENILKLANPLYEETQTYRRGIGTGDAVEPNP